MKFNRFFSVGIFCFALILNARCMDSMPTTCTQAEGAQVWPEVVQVQPEITQVQPELAQPKASGVWGFSKRIMGLISGCVSKDVAKSLIGVAVGVATGCVVVCVANTYSSTLIDISNSRYYVAALNLMFAKGMIDFLYKYSALNAKDEDKDAEEKKITKKEVDEIAARASYSVLFPLIARTLGYNLFGLIIVSGSFLSGYDFVLLVFDYASNKKIISKDFLFVVMRLAYAMSFNICAFAKCTGFTKQTIDYSKHGICPSVQPQKSLYGMCENLGNNSTICCEMHPGYVVDCCVHPNGKCLFFDLNGVNSKIDPSINLEAEFHKMAQSCGFPGGIDVKFGPVLPAPKINYSPSELRAIRQRDADFLLSLTYKSNQNLELTKFFKGLAEKFDLPGHKVVIDINSNDLYAAFDRTKHATALFYAQFVPDLFLKDVLDENISITMPATVATGSVSPIMKSVSGHEMFHVKQLFHEVQGCIEGVGARVINQPCTCSVFQGYKSVVSENPYEPEADIMGTMAAKNPCLAYFFANRTTNTVPTNMDQNNGGMMLDAASNFDPHPRRESRVALVLKTFINYNKVLEILTGNTCPK